MTDTTTQRQDNDPVGHYIVDRGHFGPEGGTSWIVWDSVERKIVDWPRTKRAAEAAARRLNGTRQ